MNSKAKGYRSERKAIALLKKSGYICVRAGASLGVFDIVAIGKNDIRLVQVKTNRKPSEAELVRIHRFSCPDDVCSREVWVFYDGNSDPDKYFHGMRLLAVRTLQPRK